jgi:predicted AAA+ superfamily ATPase
MDIVGREREIEALENCYASDKSEFVAVYGRRRVGKTYLIKTLFKNRLAFYATGILGGNNETQLNAWNAEIRQLGIEGVSDANHWMDAFRNLFKAVEQISKRGTMKKVILFLDEVPWMSAQHSEFLPGLDYFWNRWASVRDDVLLIICGSAAAWITENIVNNTGGLHNRLTRHIVLDPFNLYESELYYKRQNIPMTRYQIAEAYMIFGGIPYYMDQFQPQLSLYQNVDAIYFAPNAELRDEFTNLYRSLFKNADVYMRVIEVLAKKGAGTTRSELIGTDGMADGGTLTKILRDLTLSGFVREYLSFGKKKKDSLYQLVDFFSLFDIRFRSKRAEHSSDFWLRFSTTPAYSAWSGFAFEKLCLLHLTQIRKKLGISGVLTSAFSWIGKGDDTGAQIDLVIDRSDNVINLCEIKFSSGEYQIDKKYSELLRNKRTVFTNATHSRKAAMTTMVTTFGLKKNIYSAEIVSQVVLDDLFEAKS